MTIPSREVRALLRRDLATPDAQDARHTYFWSVHGILVSERQGKWRGYYCLRHHRGGATPPTRLLLTGIGFGDPPAELSVGYGTMLDIERNIVLDFLDNPKFVR
jgi:hypothetical protein